MKRYSCTSNKKLFQTVMQPPEPGPTCCCCSCSSCPLQVPLHPKEGLCEQEALAAHAHASPRFLQAAGSLGALPQQSERNIGAPTAGKHLRRHMAVPGVGLTA